ncbi:hypothetical protein GW796_08555 [archaeon]|nr:hypothetical protein [archaeon]
MNKPDEILYVAYKNMVFNNLKTGLLKLHISDSDYYVFDKYPEFFLELLDESKHSSSGMVKRFYELNPQRKMDLNLAKEIFKRVLSRDDFGVLLSIFKEELFTSDIPLLVKVVNNVDGLLFNLFPTLKTNNELMDATYDLNNFSLLWFDLPAPKNNELIKDILLKSPKSYLSLSLEQKENKEYALIGLQSALGISKNLASEVYMNLPEKIKEDKEISFLASSCQCVNMPPKSFVFDGVLINLLNSIYPPNLYKKANKLISLKELSELNVLTFENQRNIEVFLGWLSENKNNIKTRSDTYSLIYKLFKSITKINPYVKEQFFSKETKWNVGNLTETKHQSNRFFRDYFIGNIPLIHEEFKLYVMACEMSEKLRVNNVKEKKLKI